MTCLIHAALSETVIDAAYRQGINIPLDYRDGACGTCKYLAEAGRYALGQDYIDDALNAEGAARGYVLTCRMRTENDCVLRAPTSSTLYRTGQAHYETRISEVRQLLLNTIDLSLHGGVLVNLAFLLRQYINLQVPGSERRRAYSFSSLAKGGEVDLLVRDVSGGLMSGSLSDTVRAGGSLMMDDPLGSFYLCEVRRSLLMLAGGTDLAPFTVVSERIAEQDSAHPLHLIYRMTHDVDLVGLERLEAFAERVPGFTWSVCVASTGSDCPRKGYVTEHIVAQYLYEGNVDIYLCGSSSMVEAVGRYLREQGVRPANFYYEKFVISAT